MSIFGNNNTSLGRYDSNEIAADESYSGSIGIANILIENAINDQAVFEAVIADDFREICLSESSDIIALNESRISDFFKTIRKLIDKFIAKIKGFFKNIIDKFRKKGKEDNNTIVKEYEKKRKNLNTSKDIEKLIVKYRRPDASFLGLSSDLRRVSIVLDVKTVLYYKTEDELRYESILAKYASSYDWEKNTEKLMNEYFKKEEEYEFKDIEDSVVNVIKNYDSLIKRLETDYNAVISDLNKLKQVIDKFEKGASIDDLDDDQKRQYDNTIKTSNNNTEFINKKIKVANEVIQNYLNSVPKEAATITKLYTFEYNQAKAVLKAANAAMGSSSVNNESACIIDAIMESSMYEDSLYFE